jgi:hypothetical protein
MYGSEGAARIENERRTSNAQRRTSNVAGFADGRVFHSMLDVRRSPSIHFFFGLQLPFVPGFFPGVGS